MVSSSNPQADPDPTTQIPWPSSRKQQAAGDDEPLSPVDERRNVLQIPQGRSDANRSPSPAKQAEPGQTRLTTWDFIFLSVSMLGAQITWSVELGYGTPFLVGLGLSETATSLVWLAGPLSGLIAQPLIGAISDSSTSKYRRRYWISLSTGILVIALTTLAYCEPWARFVVDVAGSGGGDWDPKRAKQAKNLAIGFAVVAMYLLDFALNALQASIRNLLLDLCPSEQLSVGNAWHGRMMHTGNIIGFTIGFVKLEKIPIVRLLGGRQFRKLCVLTEIILVGTVWATCTKQEKERPQSLERQGAGQLSQAINNIKVAIVQLPKPIRRVCFVQLFAFMGWFPFLFYSTLYVGQVMAYERQEDPSVDEATRVGAFAMLLYSIVAVTAGTLLPELAARDARLLAHASDFASDDAELVRLRHTVLEWKAEAARQGKPVRLPYMPFLLRNIWTGALILFSVLMGSTFFITTVTQAVIMVSLVGICWAVANWVPFAIIMEFLKEMENPQEVGARGRNAANAGRRASPSPAGRPSHARVASTPAYLHPGYLSDGERQPLLRARSMDDHDIQDNADTNPVAGGTVLGVHNLAIVMPQFLISVIASAIFKAADNAPPPAAFVPEEPGHDGNVYLGKNGVAWVLRFGGLCTLVAALIARAVPPTKTEKAMRRRLAHMKVLKENGTP